MVCTHVRELYRYVKDQGLEISAHDILTVECKRCEEKDLCNTIT